MDVIHRVYKTPAPGTGHAARNPLFSNPPGAGSPHPKEERDRRRKIQRPGREDRKGGNSCRRGCAGGSGGGRDFCFSRGPQFLRQMHFLFRANAFHGCLRFLRKEILGAGEGNSRSLARVVFPFKRPLLGNVGGRQVLVPAHAFGGNFRGNFLVRQEERKTPTPQTQSFPVGF
jgi:hypothetical protein